MSNKGEFMCIPKKWLEANSHKCGEFIPQHWTIARTPEAPISLEDVTEATSSAFQAKQLEIDVQGSLPLEELTGRKF